MASLVLTGDTSGQVTIAAPAVAGTNTLTLPALTGTVLTNKTAGTVLQVVQATVSGSGSVVTTSSTSYISTGLAASITPTASTNKILITVTGGDWDTVGAWQVYATIFRNSTNLGSGTNNQFTDVTAISSRGIFPIAMQFLDSPSTTSATTYTAYFYSGGGGNSVKFNSQGGTAVINLMEIAA
jgi:hypothetical protein